MFLREYIKILFASLEKCEKETSVDLKAVPREDEKNWEETLSCDIKGLLFIDVLFYDSNYRVTTSTCINYIHIIVYLKNS